MGRFLFPTICLFALANCLAFPELHAKRNLTSPGDVQPRSVPLRVLPLGDSITNGQGSSDENGYREAFVDLAEQGGPVQMIGSREGKGDMSQNRHEGWNGYTINAISQRADNALDAKPNLVLLLAGTNNMNNVSQASTAPAEISQLIDKIFKATPRTLLLTGTIPVSTWTGRQPLNDEYNSRLATIVNERAQSGKHIILVPINSTIAVNELSDGLHPNDVGYQKMAVAWIQAVNRAQDLGWFQEAEPGNGNYSLAPLHAPELTTRKDSFSQLAAELRIEGLSGTTLLYSRQSLHR